MKEEDVTLRPLSEELLIFKDEEEQLIAKMTETAIPKTPEQMVEMIMSIQIIKKTIALYYT